MFLIQSSITEDHTNVMMKGEFTVSRYTDEVNKFRELAKTIPDVRQEKVEAIKKQIETGKYIVPAESVAKSLVDFHCDLVADRSFRLWTMMRRK